MGGKSWIDDLKYEYCDGKIRYTHNKERKCLQNIEGLKYAYDRVLGLFNSSNEYYFKRTQILMIAIQGALIVGLTNLWKSHEQIRIDLNPLPIFLAGFGLFSAIVWCVLIDRNHKHLDLLRCYLREIEMQLARMDLPLYPFTLEKRIYDKDTFTGPYCFSTKESFPDYKKGMLALPKFRIRPRHGLMGLERLIVVFLICSWFGFSLYLTIGLSLRLLVR